MLQQWCISGAKLSLCGRIRSKAHELLWINGWYELPWEGGDRSTDVRRTEGIQEREENCNGGYYFVPLLRACAKKKDLLEGTRLHRDISKRGLLASSTYLGSLLITMYAKCGALQKAQQVLHQLPYRDIVSWNALIAGYSQNSQGEQALKSYEHMQSEGLPPDGVTYSCILKACGITRNLALGTQIHDEIVTQGLLKVDIVLGGSLVDMYARCGVLTKAKEVLEDLPVRDVICWNALITGYTQQEKGEEALDCFARMQGEGISPTAITYTCIVKACAITGAVERGKQIHDEILGLGLLRDNVVLATALVDMYSKCGMLSKADEVLKKLMVRDAVLWNALIAGYAQFGNCKEALKCFQQMQSEGISPDASTFVCILKVCGIEKDIDSGEQIHRMIIDRGLLKSNLVLGTALVDMYAKCCELKKAQQALRELHVRDVVSWNALITGYAQQGQGMEALACIEKMEIEGLAPDLTSWNTVIGGYAQQGMTEDALDCFQCMQYQGIAPDAITFVCVLNACCHSGLIFEGEMFYKSMQEVHHITPNLKHQTCMIDLFARTGYFDKAITMIKKSPACDDDLLVWSLLLDACQKWGNINVGRWAFERAVHLDENDPTIYVCMEKIYVDAGMLEDAQEIVVRMQNIYFNRHLVRYCQRVD